MKSQVATQALFALHGIADRMRDGAGLDGRANPYGPSAGLRGVIRTLAAEIERLERLAAQAEKGK